MNLADLQKAKQNLQQWQLTHRQQIAQYERCCKIKQPIIQNQQLLTSPFYFMYKIKKMRCEVCHFAGGFKYFRTQSMFASNEEYTCLVFLLCQSCYLRESSLLPIPIDKKCYVPMHHFLSNIENGLTRFKQEAQYSQSNVRKYDFFQNKLSSVIWQLIKAVEKKREQVCKKVFDQIATLRQFYLDKKSQQIYDILVKQSYCDCKNQCCYCDYKSKNEQYLKANCSYFQLKKQQNDVINKIHLLNTINTSLDGVHDESIFNGIAKEVEMIIIEHMQNIEKSLNQIVKQTQNFSLLNATFLQKFVKNQIQQNENQIEIDHDVLIRARKDKYIEQGVLNQLTSDHFPSFSNTMTSISLNYMPNESILRKKLKMLNKLNSIEVGCNEIGQLLVEDTIKSYQESKKNGILIERHSDISVSEIELARVIYDKQEVNKIANEKEKNQEQGPINLNNFKQLKSVSFNCKISCKKQFFDSIEQLKLEQLYLNWNFSDFFQKYNISTHFQEDKCLINSEAPSSLQIQKYYIKHPLKNIWIGNCGPLEFQESQIEVKEIKSYISILDYMGDNIEGIMFGQFDGRSRKLQSVFYKQLCGKPTIMALFFSKIIFDAQLLLQALKCCNLMQALYFNQCEGYSHQVFNQISQLQNLKKLSFVQINIISFKKSIPTLQIFILERYFGLGGENISILLKDAKLSALSLFECRFFDDEVIRNIICQQIENKSQLSYLNLGYTGITNQTLCLINNFPKMKSLFLGGTKLKLLLLLSDINKSKFIHLRNIQKLSLKDMNEIRSKYSSQATGQVSEFYNDIFSNIFEYFPLLSHLDISFNRVINERAIRFGLTNLAYLTVTGTLYSLKKSCRFLMPLCEGPARFVITIHPKQKKFIKQIIAFKEKASITNKTQ